MKTPAKMVDLRHVSTGISLTHQERIDADYSHRCARVVSDLLRAKVDNAINGINGPRVPISTGYVPERVARAFAYVAVGGLK